MDNRKDNDMIKLTPEYLNEIDRKIYFCDQAVGKYIPDSGPDNDLICGDDREIYWEALRDLDAAKKDIFYASCMGKRAGRKRLSALIQACESIEYCYSDMKNTMELFEEANRKMEILNAKQQLEDKLNGSSPGSLRFLPEDDHFPWD